MTEKPDLDHLRQWIGRSEKASDIVTAQLVRGLRAVGIEPQEITGVVYSPLSREWSLHKRDLDVNYMLYGSKPHVVHDQAH